MPSLALGRGGSTTGPSGSQGYTQEGRGVTSGTGAFLHLPGHLLADACWKPLMLPCCVLNCAIRQTANHRLLATLVCVSLLSMTRLQPGHVQLPANLKHPNR